jgi:UDP-glucose 4-epimerase
VFNIACGAAIDLNRVLDLLGQLLGRKLSARYELSRGGDVKHSLADIEAARSVLGYQPKVLFAEGLRRTFEWFRAGSS